MSSATENKSLIVELLAAVDAGELERVLSFYDPAYLDHDVTEARADGASHHAGLRRAFAAFYGAFRDVRHRVDDLVAEGDRVVARIAVEAVHAAPIFGIPASGRRVTNDSIAIYRVRDGRIVERWCRERRSTREVLLEAARAAGATTEAAPNR
jgi:predicted ester cyclase